MSYCFKSRKAALLALLFGIMFLDHATAATILAANVGSNTVSLIDEDTLHPRAELPVGFKPHEVSVTPNGKQALVSNFGTLGGRVPGQSLTLIDIENAKVLTTIQLPDGSRPHGIYFLNDEIALITAQGSQALYVVNVTTGKIKKTIQLPSAGAHMVTSDAEQRYAYIAAESGHVCKIDLRNYSVMGDVKIGQEAEGITLTSDEELLLVTNRKDSEVAVIRAKNLMILKKIQTALGPVRVAIFNRGQSAIVTNSESGNAQIIDLASFTITKTFKTTLSHSEVNGKKIGGMVPAPNSIVIREDQMSAYITNLYAGNITLVDLANGTIEQTFEAGIEPDGLAVSKLK